MVFRARVDAFHRKFMTVITIILALSIYFPLFFEGGREWPVVIILSIIFVVFMGLVLWNVISIKYIFHPDFLHVRGGIFKSRIPYEMITRVAPTREVFTGYRVMTAREGIEVFYKTAAFGSVKISPENESEFIAELKERCPQAKFER